MPPNMVKNLSLHNILNYHDLCDPTKPPPSHAMPTKKEYCVTRLPAIPNIPDDPLLMPNGNDAGCSEVNIFCFIIH